MAEQLLEQMIQKIDQITASLDGTIAQINNMSTAINAMSQKFSEETVSLTENIRLIVEVLKQFRTRSAENLQVLSDDFGTQLTQIYEKNVIEKIKDEEIKAIDDIKLAAKSVANNVYYAQLLTIIQSIREETNRIIQASFRT